jgi:hypothetical protein
LNSKKEMNEKENTEWTNKKYNAQKTDISISDTEETLAHSQGSNNVISICKSKIELQSHER